MKRREDNPPMDKPRKESLILSYTRNQRRRRKQHILTGVCFAVLLMLCICIPRWAEYVIVDSPAGIYASMDQEGG